MSRGWAARVPGGCSVCSVGVSGFGKRDAEFARVSGGCAVCSVSGSGFSERDSKAAHRTGQRSVYGASNLQDRE